MDIIFIISLFIVAYLYASVGHGGASGYLALMALFMVAPAVMKSSALVLNVFVSLIAFVTFYRSGYFRWRVLLPFVISSVPFSFLGANISISPDIYRKILALCLALATVKMLLPSQNTSYQSKTPNYVLSLLIGGAIGLVSGMIGIGGGIILSPILVLSRWADVKESACISSAFIFLNSSAALFGLFTSHTLAIDSRIALWVVVAFLGGLTGSYIGANKISSRGLKYFLSVVLIFAAIKLYLQ
ncbi:MAG: sulfite exporter TauE/SafE family protein [Bacteroidales bacterium]|nr:sulfite exporter TauE/SafE family protein [Bacteroidales bacterium]